MSFEKTAANNNNEEGVNQSNLPIQHTLLDSQILEIIMNGSQDTIYFKDRESKFIANSKAHALQFGYDNPKDIIGKSDFDFFPKEFAEATFQDEKKIIETGIPILGKTELCVTPEGKRTWYYVSKYPIFDHNGNIIGVWGSSRDITPLKLAEQELARLNKELEITNLKLQKLSDLDGLSELYNQRRFHEILKETLHSYQNKRIHSKDATFCVMLIDIDCFKMINDKYGHPAGDTAIKYIADLIQKNVREKDICFRCGGDEFAVILFDTNLEAGMNLAKRIREIIGTSHFMHDNEAITITVSLGIGNYQDEDSINKLLSKIDKKLYHSKRQGKNQVS